MIAWNATTTATPLVNGAIDHPTLADPPGRILPDVIEVYQLSYPQPALSQNFWMLRPLHSTSPTCICTSQCETTSQSPGMNNINIRECYTLSTNSRSLHAILRTSQSCQSTRADILTGRLSPRHNGPDHGSPGSRNFCLRSFRSFDDRMSIPPASATLLSWSLSPAIQIIA